MSTVWISIRISGHCCRWLSPPRDRNMKHIYVKNERNKTCSIRIENRLNRRHQFKSWPSILTGMNMLLLTCPRILKPHLRDPLAQTRHRCDALQVLSIRIAVYLEISLKHLQLFLGECGSNAFRLAFVITVCVATVCRNSNKIAGREREKIVLFRHRDKMRKM